MFTFLKKRRARKNLELILQDLASYSRHGVLDWSSPSGLIEAISTFLNAYLASRKIKESDLLRPQILVFLVIATELADAWSRELGEDFELVATVVGGTLPLAWVQAHTPSISPEEGGAELGLLFHQSLVLREQFLETPIDSRFPLGKFGFLANRFIGNPSNLDYQMLVGFIDLYLLQRDLSGIIPTPRLSSFS